MQPIFVSNIDSESNLTLSVDAFQSFFDLEIKTQRTDLGAQFYSQSDLAPHFARQPPAPYPGCLPIIYCISGKRRNES